MRRVSIELVCAASEYCDCVSVCVVVVVACVEFIIIGDIITPDILHGECTYSVACAQHRCTRSRASRCAIDAVYVSVQCEFKEDFAALVVRVPVSVMRSVHSCVCFSQLDCDIFRLNVRATQFLINHKMTYTYTSVNNTTVWSVD